MVHPEDVRAYRRCLSRFATGVCVVTYQTPAGPRGMTINSFTSVSLEPALVVISVAKDANSFEALKDRPFTINILSAGQIDLALRFAGKPRSEGVVPWTKNAATPRMDGCVAWIDCTPWARYEAGDHELFLGEVSAFDERSGEPLLFASGAFHQLGKPIVEAPKGEPVPTNLMAPWLSSAHHVFEHSE